MSPRPTPIRGNADVPGANGGTEVDVWRELLGEIRAVRDDVSKKHGGGGDDGAGGVWSVLSRVATVILLPWLVWLSLSVMEMKANLAAINGNRFTNVEAALLEQRIRAERDRAIENATNQLRREFIAAHSGGDDD